MTDRIVQQPLPLPDVPGKDVWEKKDNLKKAITERLETVPFIQKLIELGSDGFWAAPGGFGDRVIFAANCEAEFAEGKIEVDVTMGKTKSEVSDYKDAYLWINFKFLDKELNQYIDFGFEQASVPNNSKLISTVNVSSKKVFNGTYMVDLREQGYFADWNEADIFRDNRMVQLLNALVDTGKSDKNRTEEWFKRAGDKAVWVSEGEV